MAALSFERNFEPIGALLVSQNSPLSRKVSLKMAAIADYAGGDGELEDEIRGVERDYFEFAN